MTTDSPATHRTRLILAFAALYVFWGSTYLAIRIGIATWPPLLMAATRFTITGAALYTFLRARGVPAPERRHWGSALLVGGMLLAVGNGSVCWAEQWVPSSVAALIIASTPLWMTLLPWLGGRAKAPPALVICGVLLGLAGVGVLLGGHPTASGAAAVSGPAWAPAILILATLSWAVGSLWSRRLPLPASPFLSTAMQMLAAGPLLLLAAAAHGELGHLSMALLSPTPLLAIAFLVIFGSIAGFGSYVWLLRHTSPTRASTYAFVNPLIAVGLGWALAGETLGPRTFVASALILSSVAAVVLGSAARKR
ncbi:MAG TPA: EamA family transporter [Polyangia bacterium]|jgi:drug/metabolite transporter (DMT)-like permease